jgi:hypothetical protein
LPTVPSLVLLDLAFDIASGFDRTVYDSLYLALAVQSKAQLVTADEKLANAVTGYRELETKALTGNMKERKVLRRRRREFLLFPDCSCVGSENQIGGRIGDRRCTRAERISCGHQRKHIIYWFAWRQHEARC